MESLAFTPIVSVNGDDQDLILGWEIFKLAGRLVAPPLYWAIRPDGPLEAVVDPPRTPTACDHQNEQQM